MPTQRGGRDRLGGRDGEPRRDARGGVDRRGLAHAAREAGDHLEQVLGDLGHRRGLLPDEVHLHRQLERVVGADLGPEPVLQRGDDPAAVGVVLRVGAGDEQQVQRQPQLVAADLDVALLQHVEQGDLDALGEVGQLVDGEDAAVGARDEPEVDRLGVPEGAALGDLDGVDVTDEVTDGGVGRGELLPVAQRPVQPADGQVVALGDDATPGRGRQRGVGVLVELGALDDGGPLVEQADEGAQQTRLALAAFAEQDDVVAGQQGALELGGDGVLVADDTGEAVLAGAQALDEVGPQLLLDGAVLVAGGAQRPERAGEVGGWLQGERGSLAGAHTGEPTSARGDRLRVPVRRVRAGACDGVVPVRATSRSGPRGRAG